MRAVFDGCRPRESYHAVLGGDVFARVGNGDGAERGRRVDDGSAACPQHRADLVLQAKEHAGQIDANCSLPPGFRQLVERSARLLDACIVECGVEPSKSPHGFRNEFFDVRFDADVGPENTGSWSAPRTAASVHVAIREIREDEPGAGFGERYRTGPPDAAGSAGDDDDFAVKRFPHEIPSLQTSPQGLGQPGSQMLVPVQV